MAKTATPQKQERRSPLYTSKSDELIKRTALESKGKDSDGAFRIYNRKDGNK